MAHPTLIVGGEQAQSVLTWIIVQAIMRKQWEILYGLGDRRHFGRTGAFEAVKGADRKEVLCIRRKPMDCGHRGVGKDPRRICA